MTHAGHRAYKKVIKVPVIINQLLFRNNVRLFANNAGLLSNKVGLSPPLGFSQFTCPWRKTIVFFQAAGI